MDRIIMHIDVNNAFLSWTAVSLLEAGFKYDIRDSYAVIGGDEEARHGIVLAKRWVLKQLKLCIQLVKNVEHLEYINLIIKCINKNQIPCLNI